MSTRLGPVPRRLAWFAAPPLLGLLIGVGVVLASSPSSLNPDRHPGTGLLQPTPTPLDVSPAPSVTSPGQLGEGSRLVSNGSGTLIGVGTNVAMVSTDGGKTWSAIRPPSNAAGLAVDLSNPKHLVTGGSTVQVSTDGGASWKQPVTPPPGKGPYQPVAISPLDGNVWFFVHQTRLLRTRDGSATWTDITGLPAVASPVLVPGRVLGQFFLATGNRVFQLVDNGQQVNEVAPLPQGSAIGDVAVVDANRPILVVRTGGNSAYVLTGTTWANAGGGLGGPVAAGGSRTIVVGNGGGALATPGLVKYSDDDGVTWIQAIGLPYDQTVEAISGQAGSSTYFAYCYGGDVYGSTDGGRVWVLVSRALRSTTG